MRLRSVYINKDQINPGRFIPYSRDLGKTMNQRGFTLIELLVVIAIIGVLASIMIPQYSDYRVRAYNIAALSDLRALINAQEVYYIDHEDYFDDAPGSTPLSTVPAPMNEFFTLSPGVQVSFNSVGTLPGGLQYWEAWTFHEKGNKSFCYDGEDLIRVESGLDAC